MAFKVGQVVGSLDRSKSGQTWKVAKVTAKDAFLQELTKIGGDMASGRSYDIVDLDAFGRYSVLHEPSEKKSSAKKAEKPAKPATVREWVAMHPLRSRVSDACLTQDEFATYIGVSVNSVRLWMRGRMPSEENLSACADALGINPQDLLEEIEGWQRLRPSIKKS